MTWYTDSTVSLIHVVQEDHRIFGSCGALTLTSQGSVKVKLDAPEFDIVKNDPEVMASILVGPGSEEEVALEKIRSTCQVGFMQKWFRQS